MKHKDNKTPFDLKAAPVITADSVIFCGALLVDGGVDLWHLMGMVRNTNYPIMYTGTVLCQEFSNSLHDFQKSLQTFL